MTDLLLFRHATALPATAEDEARLGPEEADARRGLTPKGERRFERFIAGLEDEDVEVDLVLHSPWRRAVETAERLRPISRGPTEVVSALAAPPGDALDAALATAGTNYPRVAIVGHQPWLGELLTRLTGAPAELVDWRKGGLVWLHRTTREMSWQIVRVAAPRRS